MNEITYEKCRVYLDRGIFIQDGDGYISPNLDKYWKSVVKIWGHLNPSEAVGNHLETSYKLLMKYSDLCWNHRVSLKEYRRELRKFGGRVNLYEKDNERFQAIIDKNREKIKRHLSIIPDSDKGMLNIQKYE